METEIKEIVEILKKGGVILYPTDTIWGLGCDPTNFEAVKRIFEIKKRVDSKSMLLLAKDMNMIQTYVHEIPEIAYSLVEADDSKPLTIIYPNAIGLASNLLADDKSIGMRIPKDPFCQKLLYSFRKPLVSTSANISGKPFPSFFDEIDEEIKSKVDYIANWRRNDKKQCLPSSIIKIEVNGVFKIIRK